MQNTFKWEQLEEDIRIGLVVVADACRFMVGMGERGDILAKAILGLSKLPDEIGLLDDLIEDDKFLKSVQIEGTQFLEATKHCFEIVTTSSPVELIDASSGRTEGAEWLSYFLGMMPREAMGGNDYSGTFSHPDAQLPGLRDTCFAKLELVEFTQGVVQEGTFGIGFTPKTVALLGGMNINTVRNVFGPNGNKPILSTAAGRGKRTDLVWGNPLDTLEWLAGRRGFDVGGITPNWVNSNMPTLQSAEAAFALPGIVAWLNRETTEDAAHKLGWEPHRFSAWVRGRTSDISSAGELAEAVGLDPKAYILLMKRLADE